MTHNVSYSDVYPSLTHPRHPPPLLLGKVGGSTHSFVLFILSVMSFKESFTVNASGYSLYSIFCSSFDLYMNTRTCSMSYVLIRVIIIVLITAKLISITFCYIVAIAEFQND